MKNCNGYSMIHRVLIKPKCIVGFRMLKVLFKLDAVLNVSTNLETFDFNCIFANKLFEDRTVIWNQFCLNVVP